MRILTTILAALILVVVVPGESRAAGPACSVIPGLTHPDLCVSVQAESSGVRPGGTAEYVVGVSVAGGTALDVTVSLSASAGNATFTSSCIIGAGTSHCWLATMNFLGSPSSDHMQARLPVGAAGSSVTLTATASVPTLAAWTPPSASATTALVTPSAPDPPSASTSPATQAQPSPSASGDPAPPRKITGTISAARSAPTRGAGSASGLFPVIRRSATPAAAARAEPVAGGGIRIGPIAIGIGLALAVGWVALAVPGLYRRKRSLLFKTTVGVGWSDIEL